MIIDYAAEFACRPDKLWRYLEEPELQKQWMTGLLENQSLDGGPGHVGSRFRMKIKEGAKVADYEGEITAWDKPRHLGVKLWGGNFQAGWAMLVDYHLSDEGHATRLDYHAELKADRISFILRLFMPLIRIFGRLQLKKFMKNLKKLVEAEG